MMTNEFDYLVFTIIFCDIATCTKELGDYLNEEEDKYEVLECNNNFKAIYFPAPPKGGAHLSNILLWEPKNLNGASCFFTNYEDGRYTLVFNYCKEFKHKAIKVAYSNSHATSPAFMFNYIDFSNNKQVERIIYLIRDDANWEFFTKGKPIHFENVKNYSKKRKADRFNKTIILEYLQNLGIDINNEQFWDSYHKSTCFRQTKW